jgi:hypothetical protein
VKSCEGDRIREEVMDRVLDEFFLMNSGLMRKNWLQPLRTFICSHQDDVSATGKLENQRTRQST